MRQTLVPHSPELGVWRIIRLVLARTVSIMVLGTTSVSTTTMGADLVFSTDEQSTELGDPIVKIGNFALRLGLSTESTYTRRQSEQELADDNHWDIRNTLEHTIVWPISRHLRLGAEVGVGYIHEIDGEDGSGFILSGLEPGTAAEFEFAITTSETSQIVVSDIISRDYESLDIDERTANDDLTYWNNRLNIAYTAQTTPFTHVVLQLSRIDRHATESTFNSDNSLTHQAAFSWERRVTARSQYGIFASVGDQDFREDVRPDESTWSIGISGENKLSETATIAGRVGHSDTAFDGNLISGATKSSGLFGDLTCTLRMWDGCYGIGTVSVERDTSHTIGVGSEERLEIEAEIDWQLNRRWRINVLVENAWIREEAPGEQATILTPTVALSYIGLGGGEARVEYAYTEKSSDTTLSSYSRHSVSFELTYEF